MRRMHVLLIIILLVASIILSQQLVNQTLDVGKSSSVTYKTGSNLPIPNIYTDNLSSVIISPNDTWTLTGTISINSTGVGVYTIADVIYGVRYMVNISYDTFWEEQTDECSINITFITGDFTDPFVQYVQLTNLWVGLYNESGDAIGSYSLNTMDVLLIDHQRKAFTINSMGWKYHAVPQNKTKINAFLGVHLSGSIIINDTEYSVAFANIDMNDGLDVTVFRYSYPRSEVNVQYIVENVSSYDVTLLENVTIFYRPYDYNPDYVAVLYSHLRTITYDSRYINESYLVSFGYYAPYLVSNWSDYCSITTAFNQVVEKDIQNRFSLGEYLGITLVGLTIIHGFSGTRLGAPYGYVQGTVKLRNVYSILSGIIEQYLFYLDATEELVNTGWFERNHHLEYISLTTVNASIPFREPKLAASNLAGDTINIKQNETFSVPITITNEGDLPLGNVSTSIDIYEVHNNTLTYAGYSFILLSPDWNTIYNIVFQPQETRLFNFTFRAPADKTGLYKICVGFYYNTITGTRTWVATSFLVNVTSNQITPMYTTLDVKVDVGRIHFRGEIAEFYVLTALNGSPVNATITEALLYFSNGTLTKDLTNNSKEIATGLYRISYVIPTDAPKGTYTLLVKAEYVTNSTVANGVSFACFQLSPTLTEWGARLVSINGSLAILRTDIGEISVAVESLYFEVISIKDNVAVIKTNIGEILANISALNLQLVSLSDNVATLNTSIGEIKANLSDLDTRIIAIALGIDNIENILKTWTGASLNISDYSLLILTNSTIVKKSVLTDEIVKLTVSGIDGTHGSMFIIIQKSILSTLKATVDDIVILLDNSPINFEITEYPTYFLVRISYEHSEHELTIHFTGNIDSDSDGVPNWMEYIAGTSQEKADTDSDLWNDSIDPWPNSAILPDAIIVVALIATAVLVFIKRTIVLKTPLK
ncbi:MAG: hypothetical protein ACP6IS_11200 [Candidatus Asgardarchaeia archaeon]